MARDWQDLPGRTLAACGDHHGGIGGEGDVGFSSYQLNIEGRGKLYHWQVGGVTFGSSNISNSELARDTNSLRMKTAVARAAMIDKNLHAFPMRSRSMAGSLRSSCDVEV